MAVTPAGRLATVTNRWCDGIDPSRRSRGELPLALLAQADADVRQFLEGLPAHEYNPFNVLYVSASQAIVGHADGARRLRITTLQPGAHVLTLRDVDQTGDPKTEFLRRGLDAALQQACDGRALLDSMQELLTEHGDGDRGDLDATCVHGNGYGTVSATSMLIGREQVLYRHSAGPPCFTPWRDLSGLFQSECGTASTS